MIFASSLARSSHDGGSVPARSSAPAHSSTVADGFTPSNVGARFLFWPETPARSSTRVCTSTLARTLGLRPHALMGRDTWLSLVPGLLVLTSLVVFGEGSCYDDCWISSRPGCLPHRCSPGIGVANQGPNQGPCPLALVYSRFSAVCRPLEARHIGWLQRAGSQPRAGSQLHRD